nr:MAG TPA: hypothetical protein [Caudoviricetes sp.]
MKKLCSAALAAAMLLTVPITASASSKDYTEGYQAGYQDGFRQGYQAALFGFSETTPASAPTEAAVEVEPKSGTILFGEKLKSSGKITVNASKESAVVVCLKTAAGVTHYAFYVQAGDSVTVNVPNEVLYAFFASGDGSQWRGYGQGKLFGDTTVYTKDIHTLYLKKYHYTYTLYPVTDGNFSETPSDESEFF